MSAGVVRLSVLAAVLAASAGPASAAATYTNWWAVEIAGTAEQADTLAQKYEFINKGTVWDVGFPFW